MAVGYRRDIYDFRKAIAGRFTVKDKVLGTDIKLGLNVGSMKPTSGMLKSLFKT